MFGVNVIMLRNHKRLILKKPRKKQAAYIKALGLNESVYTNPNFKFKPIMLLQDKNKP
jgi:hypothetical protein